MYSIIKVSEESNRIKILMELLMELSYSRTVEFYRNARTIANFYC